MGIFGKILELRFLVKTLNVPKASVSHPICIDCGSLGMKIPLDIRITCSTYLVIH